MSVKVGLPPVARSDARLFLLGSLPGEASLAAARYYAHPSNQFWRLLGAAIGEPLHELDYDRRLERLAERKVGLWDVIQSARRTGSLDQAIRAANHNRIDSLLLDFPELRAIAFNGATAARIGRRLFDAAEGVELIDLPSSSAANTQSFGTKLASWTRLADFVLPAQGISDGRG